MYWAFLLGAIVLAIGGQGLLKAGAGAGTFVAQLQDLRTIVGLAAYGGSALFYIVALRRIPLSVALPCTAISYVFVAAIGHFAFGEAMNLQRMLGLACITVGVVVLAAS